MKPLIDRDVAKLCGNSGCGHIGTIDDGHTRWSCSEFKSTWSCLAGSEVTTLVCKGVELRARVRGRLTVLV